MKSKNKVIPLILVGIFFIVYHGRVLSSPVNDEKITITPELKEKITHSPYKAALQTKNGQKFVAYLYAEDEKDDLIDGSCMNREGPPRVSKVGHFYIYLYNVDSDYFFNKRKQIFDGEEHRFNVDGAGIIVLASHKVGKSDVLFISQYGDCSGNFFEAYGFSDDNSRLEKYKFKLGNKEGSLFYGTIKADEGGAKLYCSTFNYETRDVDQYILSLGENKLILFKLIDYEQLRAMS